MKLTSFKFPNRVSLTQFVNSFYKKKTNGRKISHNAFQLRTECQDYGNHTIKN